MNVASVSSFDQTSGFYLKVVDSFTRLFVSSIEVNQCLRFCELETMWNIAVSLTAFISNYASSNLVDCDLQFNSVILTSNLDVDMVVVIIITLKVSVEELSISRGQSHIT